MLNFICFLNNEMFKNSCMRDRLLLNEAKIAVRMISFVIVTLCLELESFLSHSIKTRNLEPTRMATIS